MEQKYIRVAKEAEESYSFAVGDGIRRCIITPWRLPFLPYLLIKKIFAHRKNLKLNQKIKSLTDCIFIFDLEKMRPSDKKSFASRALNYSENSIGIGIGASAIGMGYNHVIQTRRQLNIEAKDWNLMLENFLIGIVRSYKPKKIVFVGKYPYAGIMAVLRKCKPAESFFWIHVRGNSDVVEQRSAKFNLTEEISFFTDQDSIVRNTIYFDYEPPKHLVRKLKKNGINMIQTKEHAEYMSLVGEDYDFKGMLMKNQTLFLNPENEKRLGLIPNYLLTNQVTCELENISDLIEVVSTFRKGVIGKKSPVMTVEAKLDLWLNQSQD